MRAELKRIVTGSALLLMGAPFSAATAEELVAHHRVLEAETSGGITSGTIEVWVGNFTAAEFQNVDLRSEGADLFAGDSGVLQLGTIPAGEARVVSGFFMAASPVGMDVPLSWSAEFDRPDGHAQAIVPSFSLDLE